MTSEALTLAERLDHQAKGDAWHCTAQAAALLRSQDARIAELERERDEARDEVDECRIDIKTLAAERDALQRRLAEAVEALAWYGEQARLARLIHSEGDAGRHALSADGGKRARSILKDKANG